jgi:hypothetical protein
MDFTWYYATNNIWLVIEVNCAIVVACLLTLRPLAARCFPRVFRSTRGSDGGGGGASPGRRRTGRRARARATERNQIDGAGETEKSQSSSMADEWANADVESGPSEGTTAVEKGPAPMRV